MTMRFTERQQRFSQQLTAAQSRLYAYIMSMVADGEAADEVLQRANVVMLRKAEEYDEATPFVAWACRIAHFEVKGFRRDRAREHGRLRFDDEFIDRMADEAAERASDFERRRKLLHGCMTKLSDDQRSLLLRRYTPGESVERIATSIGRPVGSVSQTLYRIRRVLVDCIRRTLGEEAGELGPTEDGA